MEEKQDNHTDNTIEKTIQKLNEYINNSQTSLSFNTNQLALF